MLNDLWICHLGGLSFFEPNVAFSPWYLTYSVVFFPSFQLSLQLSVGIENGNLESYNSDFELQFSHPLKHIVGMCRIVHKQGGKQVGNGFMQIKTAQQQQQPSHSQSNGLTSSSLASSNGFKSTLKTSTSYGSLSSSAAASYQQQQLQQQQQQQQQSQDTNGDNGVPNNFMEFTGPITGLVYLMKEPKDPLLHIYLFECDAVEEVSSFFIFPLFLFCLLLSVSAKSCNSFYGDLWLWCKLMAETEIACPWTPMKCVCKLVNGCRI